MGTHYVFFSLYLQKELGVSNAYLSFFWAFGSVVETIMFLYTGRLVRRFGTKWFLVLGMFGIAFRLGVYAAFPNIPVIFLVQGLHALTFAAVHVSTVTFVNYAAPEKWRASAQTIWEGITIGLGTAAGAFAGGLIAHRYGYRTLYTVMSVVAAAAAVAFVLFGRPAAQSRASEPVPAPDPSEE
jgi:PPP family 3-phenylpropionic acid transporter